MILQVTLSNGFFLYAGDCTNAFLQGGPDTSRPSRVYLRPPSDPIARQAVPEWNETTLYELLSTVYGLAHAPRLSYHTASSV